MEISMYYFKKALGFSGGLKDQIGNTKIKNATMYRVQKDARNIILHSCSIQFEAQETGEFLIKFNGAENGQQRQYAFPIHTEMDLVTFTMNKGGKTNACFEWLLDESGEHIGCYMDPKEQNQFRDVTCQVIKHLMQDDLIKDHMKLCKQLSGIPVYKQNDSAVKSSSISSTTSKMMATQINEILLREANKNQNKMVNSAILYEIVNKQRSLINQSVVFTIHQIDNYLYEFQIINATGFAFLKKQITPSLVYEVNVQGGYLKWLQLEAIYNKFGETQPSKIIQVNFEGKKDVAMSLKFGIQECLYEYNTKKKITDAIDSDQIEYLKRMENSSRPVNAKIVQTYEDDKQDILQINEAKFVYGDKNADKGLQKYRNLCQAKINNFEIASLGSMLETLRISQGNEIKLLQKKRFPKYNNQQLKIDTILLSDKDTKAMMNDENGNLHHYDLETGKIVDSYELSRKGIQDICPEYKLAETHDFKTFKAISPNTIYEVDTRLKEGSTNLKSYKTSPQFNRIAVDIKGKFAVSSTNGDIRLFNEIGKNANCKFPGFGDPVLHLESTKDGKWLLATFKTYLLLLPTQTEDQISLYQEKTVIKDRLDPIKLTIKLDHLQLCNVKDYTMIPAKFDERKGGKEMFIVSGFQDYVVIWNLAHVIKGDKYNYKFTKVGGQLVQTDFMFDNIKKLIMTTDSGIIIKENKVK